MSSVHHAEGTRRGGTGRNFCFGFLSYTWRSSVDRDRSRSCLGAGGAALWRGARLVRERPLSAVGLPSVHLAVQNFMFTDVLAISPLRLLLVDRPEVESAIVTFAELQGEPIEICGLARGLR